MHKFYKVKTANIKKESTDAVSIGFTIPAEYLELFKYIPGQYLTVRVILGGEEYRRSYSICSSPYKSEQMRIAVKKVNDGRVSTFLNNVLKEGDELDIMLPNGRFYPTLDSAYNKQYVFFAGGSGITPIISIIQSILCYQPKSRVVLFYGNSDSESIIFKDILQGLVSEFKARYTQFHIVESGILESELYYTGRMTEEMVERLLHKHVNRNADDEYFICGPALMMKNVENILSQAGVRQSNIHVEYFSSIPVKQEIEELEFKVINQNLMHVKIIMGGIETSFEYPVKKTSILDAAINAGIDAPYSCKEAICCSCKGKVLEGKVKMINNYALLDEEVEEGYVLTCQSYPLTETVIISYDV